jgi:hypothetical protein
MKKKLLCVMLAASLVLSVVIPGTALAAKGKAFDDFEATGEITEIDEGTVFPAGNSGRWRVTERHILGVFTAGDIAGASYVMTYKANVDSEQTGTFHGELRVDELGLSFKVRGKSEMGDEVMGSYDFFPVLVPNPDYPDTSPDPYIVAGLVPVVFRALNTSGGWTLVEGAKGNGIYEGTTIVAIGTEGDQAGHIVGIHTAAIPYVLSQIPGLPPYPDLTPSGIDMTGKWKQ